MKNRNKFINGMSCPRRNNIESDGEQAVNPYPVKRSAALY